MRQPHITNKLAINQWTTIVTNIKGLFLCTQGVIEDYYYYFLVYIAEAIHGESASFSATNR